MELGPYILSSDDRLPNTRTSFSSSMSSPSQIKRMVCFVLFTRIKIISPYFAFSLSNVSCPVSIFHCISVAFNRWVATLMAGGGVEKDGVASCTNFYLSSPSCQLRQRALSVL
jgi:hypothetical protein